MKFYLFILFLSQVLSQNPLDLINSKVKQTVPKLSKEDIDKIFQYDVDNMPEGSSKIQGNINISGKIWTDQFVTQQANVESIVEGWGMLTSNTFTSETGFIENVYVDLIDSINKNGSFSFESNLYISSLEATSIKASSFLIKNVRQWQLHSHDDFDSQPALEGWNKNLTSHCDQDDSDESEKDFFIGGPCKLSYDEVSKTFTNLPNHKHIRINANFHMFDNWEGEKAYMKVNGNIVWSRVGNSIKDAKGMDICGGSYSDPKFALPIDITIPHVDSQIKLTFGSTLKKEACEASFGVDDVMIYIK